MASSSSVHPIQLRNFFAIIPDEPWSLTAAERLGQNFGPDMRMRVGSDGRLLVGYELRGSGEKSVPAPSSQVRFLLGDSGDFVETQAETPMANGVLLECDFAQSSIRAIASII